MNNQDTIFANGLIAKKKDNQPNFVVCSLSVKVDDFTAFLNQHVDNGWVNIQVLKSKDGKPYAKLDTWKPQVPTNGTSTPPQAITKPIGTRGAVTTLAQDIEDDGDPLPF